MSIWGRRVDGWFDQKASAARGTRWSNRLGVELILLVIALILFLALTGVLE